LGYLHDLRLHTAYALHFGACCDESMSQVGLGDFVEVYSGKKDADGNDRPWIMEVTEFFEDAQVHHHQEHQQERHTALISLT